MIDFKYVPIIKTGDAELKALSNLSTEVQQSLTPLIELTRGRRSAKDKMGELTKRLEKLKQLQLKAFFLDLTGDSSLSNPEIDIKRTSVDGYKMWRDFCISLKDTFPTLCPVIQIEENENYSDYLNNLLEQILFFQQNFTCILFRVTDTNSNNNINIITDINNLLKMSNQIDTNKIYYMFDCGFIQDTITHVSLISKCAQVLSNIGLKKIIVSSTSYPNSISEKFGNVENGEVQCKLLIQNETQFFSAIKKATSDDTISWIYSDYASVNPIRNDNIVMARGWIPRIDLPHDDTILVYRRKRETSSYATRYKEIAECISKNPSFISLKNNNPCWGIDEIQKASDGIISGANITFWISVRINIYLSLKVNEFRLAHNQ